MPRRTPHGNLYVAWDSYRTGNYDIFLRRVGADGTLGPIQQVTKSSRFQAHASLAVEKADRVWLAWDESGANWGKDYARDDTWRGTTLYTDRRPRVAVLENGKWSAAGRSDGRHARALQPLRRDRPSSPATAPDASGWRSKCAPPPP